MSGPTRPIPINQGRSQRNSPTGSDNISPTGMISQSCPVNGHGAAYFGPRHQPPPRAPVIGSLPEPSFLLGGLDAMPELVLPPPAQFENVPARRESVVPVASSCPVDIGFFRHASASAERSWTPSPRAADEFDLSKSPALAVMSAMRQAHRLSSGSQSGADDDQNRDQRSRSLGIGRRISDPSNRLAPNSFVSTSLHFLGEEEETDELHSEQYAMENLSLGGTELPSSTPGESSGLLGLPPRRPERRGSYDGGVFHFEDQ